MTKARALRLSRVLDEHLPKKLALVIGTATEEAIAVDIPIEVMYKEIRMPSWRSSAWIELGKREAHIERRYSSVDSLDGKGRLMVSGRLIMSLDQNLGRKRRLIPNLLWNWITKRWENGKSEQWQASHSPRRRVSHLPHKPAAWCPGRDRRKRSKCVRKQSQANDARDDNISVFFIKNPPSEQRNSSSCNTDQYKLDIDTNEEKDRSSHCCSNCVNVPMITRKE